MSEADLQRVILDWLKIRGILHWRCELGGLRGGRGGGRRPNPMSGFPDIAGLWKRRFFVIEVKAPKGVLSPSQIEWRDKLVGQGCVYILARSVDDVMTGFDGILAAG